MPDKIQPDSVLTLRDLEQLLVLPREQRLYSYNR